ncbi:MAG: DUF3078 domain-containing protein [Flavobacteriales bacterium]|nr:DUF3078 domain-containing protein [Flavobacteriales bacterium]
MNRIITCLAVCLLTTGMWAQDNNKVLTSSEENQLVQNMRAQDDATPSDTLWTKGGTFGLNMSQVYLDNWAAGGQSSISVNGLVNLFANYAKGKSAWDNTLDLAYGMLWQGDAAGVKTDDKLDFASKYGYQASKAWFYSALLNFRTQFAPGYDDPFAPDSVRNTISNFMAPGYVLAALGMDYKPNDKFTAFISPITSKMTIVNDQTLANAGAFGVEAAVLDTSGSVITAGKKFRQEFGGYVKMMYRTDLVKNVSLQTKLDLFSNYLHNPQNIDVNWETLISMKINEFLSTTITTTVLYDDDIKIARNDDERANGTGGPATQFKEVLAVGFSYKF